MIQPWNHVLASRSRPASTGEAAMATDYYFLQSELSLLTKCYRCLFQHCLSVLHLYGILGLGCNKACFGNPRPKERTCSCSRPEESRGQGPQEKGGDQGGEEALRGRGVGGALQGPASSCCCWQGLGSGRVLVEGACSLSPKCLCPKHFLLGYLNPKINMVLRCGISTGFLCSFELSLLWSQQTVDTFILMSTSNL